MDKKNVNRVTERKYTFSVNKQKDVQPCTVKELENVAVVRVLFPQLSGR